MIISIEGQDGAGKTTVATELAKLIGPDVSVHAWPNRATRTGVIIDEMLRQGGSPAEYLQTLMLANRLEHMLRLPHTIHVRWKWSGYIYGELEGLDPTWLRAMAAVLPEPTHHVLIAEDAHVCYSRVMARTEKDGRYEARPYEWFETLYWRYQTEAIKEATDGAKVYMCYPYQGDTAADRARRIYDWLAIK